MSRNSAAEKRSAEINIAQQINPTEAEDCREILVNTIQANIGRCENLYE